MLAQDVVGQPLEDLAVSQRFIVFQPVPSALQRARADARRPQQGHQLVLAVLAGPLAHVHVELVL